MGEVICVLHFESQRWDLVLPDNIPVHLIIDSLIKSLNLPCEQKNSYELFYIENGNNIRIPSSLTLQQSMILNGTDLSLVQNIDQSENSGYLVSTSGVVFPLRENNILGRYTIEKYVDIDLSTLDKNKVVSRNHAIITRVMNNYFIKDAGSLNGTFINGEQIPKGQSVTLQPEDEVCFGPLDRGIKMWFKINN